MKQMLINFSTRKFRTFDSAAQAAPDRNRPSLAASSSLSAARMKERDDSCAVLYGVKGGPVVH
jgi:hypothetical protein